MEPLTLVPSSEIRIEIEDSIDSCSLKSGSNMKLDYETTLHNNADSDNDCSPNILTKNKRNMQFSTRGNY